MRSYLPKVGWPVYDLRRRRFGICVAVSRLKMAVDAHIEGDYYPRTVYPQDSDYEYPKLYINDTVLWKSKDNPKRDAHYYIKHVHYHVPNDIWQYTIAQQGIDGFDRITVEGHDSLELIKSYDKKL